MTERVTQYARETENAAFGPLNKSWDVTPSASPMFIPSRSIMVSTDATVTGYLKLDDTIHTTFELKPGILYPFEFRIITAVSTGTVKAYA